MKPIIKTTDNIEIIQDNLKDENTYKIIFPKYSEALIKSITKNKTIQGATITDNYKTLTFKALSLSKLKNKLNYESVLYLITNISDQIKYLSNEYKKGYLLFIPENIIVINNSKYIYLSNEYLFNFESPTNIEITYPFSLNEKFISPEVKQIKNIPYQIHYKTIYYSLAYLVIDILKNKIEEGKKDEQDNREKDEQDNKKKDEQDKAIEKLKELKEIKGTKLFFLLKRMLLKNPEERSIIFI